MFSGFFGQFEHSIDEKGRVTFPALFRENLDSGARVFNGFDGNLLVMTKSRFDRLYELINTQSMGNADSRELRRFIFSTATLIEFDKNGRFIIPQVLRDNAALDGSALILGIGNDIEIWNPELYKKQSDPTGSAKTAAEMVANFDLTF